ncbi:hypothetical protein M434DRAFT_31448 [Hypoxylon sp. CO27-5]|nr:hypothetical protein M434DRAFT_31448 [Hypoxylon sp. CO27-5]
MPLSAPTPSLLLTKRLTAFLSSNLSPQLHTAVLTTPSGKLLAHASPHPVGTLRTQCTVAASIWALYSSPTATDTVTDALPHSESQSSARPIYSRSGSGSGPSAVTIQLTGGVMVIRRLRCGLLFVCIGPTGAAEDATANTNTNTHTHTQTQAQGHVQGRPMPAPAGTSGSGSGSGNEPHPTTPLGSPSEVESVASAGAATTASIATTTSVAASAVVATRRQAEELARWLDDKLGTLGVVEEGVSLCCQLRVGWPLRLGASLQGDGDGDAACEFADTTPYIHTESQWRTIYEGILEAANSIDYGIWRQNNASVGAFS